MDWPARHFDTAQALHHLGAGARAHGGGDERHEGVAVFDAQKVGGETWVCCDLRDLQHIAEPLELRIIAHGQQEMPIATFKRIVGYDVGVRIAAPHGFLAGCQEVRTFIDQPRHLRINQ